MNPPPVVRRMSVADIEPAAALEREAFEPGWTTTDFARELSGNKLARYIAVETVAGGPIAGFAGLWLVVDQAHVITVAVAPPWRRHGLARLLVLGLLRVASAAGMDDATLECRRSNLAARSLYRGFGFHEVAERQRYYADGEDAVIMTTESLAGPTMRARLAEVERLASASHPGWRFLA